MLPPPAPPAAGASSAPKTPPSALPSPGPVEGSTSYRAEDLPGARASFHSRGDRAWSWKYPRLDITSVSAETAENSDGGNAPSPPSPAAVAAPSLRRVSSCSCTPRGVTASLVLAAMSTHEPVSSRASSSKSAARRSGELVAVAAAAAASGSAGPTSGNCDRTRLSRSAAEGPASTASASHASGTTRFRVRILPAGRSSATAEAGSGSPRGSKGDERESEGGGGFLPSRSSPSISSLNLGSAAA